MDEINKSKLYFHFFARKKFHDNTCSGKHYIFSLALLNFHHALRTVKIFLGIWFHFKTNSWAELITTSYYWYQGDWAFKGERGWFGCLVICILTGNSVHPRILSILLLTGMRRWVSVNKIGFKTSSLVWKRKQIKYFWNLRK